MLLAHQRAMGVAQTLLLPAGMPVSGPSAGGGKYNGPGGNDAAVEMAHAHPKEI